MGSFRKKETRTASQEHLARLQEVYEDALRTGNYSAALAAADRIAEAHGVEEDTRTPEQRRQEDTGERMELLTESETHAWFFRWTELDCPEWDQYRLVLVRAEDAERVSVKREVREGKLFLDGVEVSPPDYDLEEERREAAREKRAARG